MYLALRHPPLFPRKQAPMRLALHHPHLLALFMLCDWYLESETVLLAWCIMKRFERAHILICVVAGVQLASVS